MQKSDAIREIILAAILRMAGRGARVEARRSVAGLLLCTIQVRDDAGLDMDGRK